MTFEISLTLSILALAVILFITEKIRMDVVALLVLVGLALTGLVSPSEALSGFSNPAVVTVWAVFVLSGGLSQTGVANLVGAQIIRLAGSGEVRLIIIIMLTAGVMSAFMNNVGVAALLLPVVVSIARRTDRHPSRLLMPLAVGCLLGGMTTLIGTPPNILASDALRDAGFEPLNMFDFMPVGGIATILGVIFMVLIGRHLLPKPSLTTSGDRSGQAVIEQSYLLQERLSRIRIPADSPLAGRTLADTRLSAALGLTVLNVSREGRVYIVPDPGTQLRGGDVLTVSGRIDTLEQVKGRPLVIIDDDQVTVADLITPEISLAEIRITENSIMVNQTLRQLNFRQNFGVIVLGLWREEKPEVVKIDNISLQPEDVLLVQGYRDRIEELKARPDCEVTDEQDATAYRLEERLLRVCIPEDSPLVGKPLAQSQLSQLAGLAVLGIVREGQVEMMIDPHETILRSNDRLYVKGNAAKNLEELAALQDLMTAREELHSLRDLESDLVGMLEVVLSPHSSYAGRSLTQLDFRKRYDLNVIAIFREGRAYRTNVGFMSLRFGDALLLHGSREKLALMAKDENFISLADDIQPSPRVAKAPLAVGIMFAFVTVVLLGWVPVAVAAIAGALLMVLTGCMSIDEAYREIEWRAVFLIAGMLPLGIAMDTTGTARLIADAAISSIGSLGIQPMIAVLFTLTVLASQFMPNAVVTVLMAPIALTAAGDLGLSHYAIMMVVAFGSSASFLSPVGHPANLLVMAPGGYRFIDFVRVGFPLTIIMLLIAVFVLPIFWPLS